MATREEAREIYNKKIEQARKLFQAGLALASLRMERAVATHPPDTTLDHLPSLEGTHNQKQS